MTIDTPPAGRRGSNAVVLGEEVVLEPDLLVPVDVPLPDEVPLLFPDCVDAPDVAAAELPPDVVAVDESSVAVGVSTADEVMTSVGLADASAVLPRVTSANVCEEASRTSAVGPFLAQA